MDNKLLYNVHYGLITVETMKKLLTILLLIPSLSTLTFNVEARMIMCSYIDNPNEIHNFEIIEDTAEEISPFGLKILYKSVLFENDTYTLKNSSGAMNQKRSWIINLSQEISNLFIEEDSGELFKYEYRCHEN